MKIGLKYVATLANIFKSPYVVLEVQHSLNNNNLKLCVKMKNIKHFRPSQIKLNLNEHAYLIKYDRFTGL